MSERKKVGAGDSPPHRKLSGLAAYSALGKPIKYIGGKHRLLKHLLRCVPEGGRPYCEPYAGGASLFWARDRAPVEVLNDLDGDLVNFYRALQDEESYHRLKHVLEWTLYSRAELKRAIDTLRSDERDAVKRAWAFFVSFRMGFAGRKAKNVCDFGVAIKESHENMAIVAFSYQRAVAKLPAFHARLVGVQIECDDGVRCIERYDNHDAVFYVDPPYHPDTMQKQKYYRHMMTHEEHERLVEALLKVKGAAVLSCYMHPVYEPLVEAGWKAVKVKTVAYSAGAIRGSGLRGCGARREKAAREETILINPRAVEMTGEQAESAGELFSYS